MKSGSGKKKDKKRSPPYPRFFWSVVFPVGLRANAKAGTRGVSP